MEGQGVGAVQVSDSGRRVRRPGIFIRDICVESSPLPRWEWSRGWGIGAKAQQGTHTAQELGLILPRRQPHRTPRVVTCTRKGGGGATWVSFVPKQTQAVFF